VSGAREGLSADSGSLVGALGAFDTERADYAIEAVLALRPLERTVSEVLLPSLDEVARRHGTDSAPWAFAAHWGASWLRRSRRLAPAPTRPFSVLVGDACRDDLDTDSPHVRALELLVARGGVDVLSLSVRGLTGMTEALSSRPLNAVVLAGGHYTDDAVARWAYAVRTAMGPQPVLIYRRGAARLRVRTAGGGGVLPLGAGEAAQVLIERLHETASGPGAPAERGKRRAAS
jgi:hypothetical protein